MKLKLDNKESNLSFGSFIKLSTLSNLSFYLILLLIYMVFVFVYAIINTILGVT